MRTLDEWGWAHSTTARSMLWLAWQSDVPNGRRCFLFWTWFWMQPVLPHVLLVTFTWLMPTTVILCLFFHHQLQQELLLSWGLTSFNLASDVLPWYCGVHLQFKPWSFFTLRLNFLAILRASQYFLCNLISLPEVASGALYHSTRILLVYEEGASIANTSSFFIIFIPVSIPTMLMALQNVFLVFCHNTASLFYVSF